MISCNNVCTFVVSFHSAAYRFWMMDDKRLNCIHSNLSLIRNIPQSHLPWGCTIFSRNLIKLLVGSSLKCIFSNTSYWRLYVRKNYCGLMGAFLPRCYVCCEIFLPFGTPTALAESACFIIISTFCLQTFFYKRPQIRFSLCAFVRIGGKKKWWSL